MPNSPDNCNFSLIVWLIIGAIVMLSSAMALAYFVLNIPALIAAMVLVLAVILILMLPLPSALKAYATCRGSIGDCSITQAWNLLGTISLFGALGFYALALGFEISAIAAFLSFWLAWLAPFLTLTALGMVVAGNWACLLAIGLLLGVLTDALNFKICCDKHGGA